MTANRILALVALGLAVAAFVVTKFPLLIVSVIILSIVEILRG